MLPAVPFAFPEDAWFDSTRQDLPQRGPSNQSRPPTALELPDLPPSSLLSLCESGNTTSSNSEPRLWPTLTLEGFPYASDARVGKPRHGTHPGPALTVLLPVLVAAVLLAAAAAVFICLRPAMRPRPRTSRVMYTEKAVVCTFSILSLSQGVLRLLVSNTGLLYVVGNSDICAPFRPRGMCT